MRGLSFAAGLVVAVFVHVVGTSLWSGFPLAFDLFLVLTIFFALEGGLVTALVGGLVAGLVTDALTGGPYGLFGIADTILGYGGALLARSLVIQRAASVLSVFSLAAAVQQLILLGLAAALLSDFDRPTLFWVTARLLTTGLLGVTLFQGRKLLGGALERRRRRRSARLR